MARRILLITLPDYEDTTFYCSEWSKAIIEEAEKKNFEIVPCAAEKANAANFQSRIEKHQPVFIVINGHGTKTQICGQNDEAILEEGKNESLTKGRIVYARTCWALSGLGESCVKNAAARGFVGYKLPFTFISDAGSGAHPLKDALAAPCFITSNIIPISLIKGNTVSQAVEKAKAEMQKEIEKWQVRDDLAEAPFVALTLFWNSAGLGYCGKPDEKL